MGCSGCSSGRGCSNEKGSVPAGCNSNGSCGTGSCNKLNVFDWLGNMSLPGDEKPFDLVEIRFKNSRKDFFKNVNALSLNVGDVVAVEASPGHDVGVVSLSGELVRLQMKKKGVNFDSEEIRKVYRKAKQSDIDKWKEAQSLEVDTMYRARTIALQLGLKMKLSDVEYQGDKSKAIFYYTADERVDFRELIKKLAEEFKVRVEMRQIGARQEASRLGGIGACGRELCCSTWLTDYRTVSTSAARYQQLSLNPLKLAGQCGKLKCCLNYELDSYVDALKEFPEMENKRLNSEKGEAFLVKTDIFKRVMWFAYRKEPDVFLPLTIARVKEVMAMNQANELPESVEGKIIYTTKKEIIKEPNFENVVGQDSLTRFDKRAKGNQQNNNRNKGNNKPGGQGRNPQAKQQKTGATDKPQQQKNLNPNPNQKPRNEGNNSQKSQPQKRNPHHKKPNNNRPNNNDKKSPQ
jgi:cell fate regulator YaaT (PSP1 superfamily)